MLFKWNGVVSNIVSKGKRRAHSVFLKDLKEVYGVGWRAISEWAYSVE